MPLEKFEQLVKKRKSFFKSKKIEQLVKKRESFLKKHKLFAKKMHFYIKKAQPFFGRISPYIKKCTETIKNLYTPVISFLKSKITSWWQVVIIVLFCIIFLYYPIGSLIINDIDTSSDFHPQTSDGRLASVDTMSHLINREVHHKLWTPNLPFLFPSYVLDNMPAFQTGIMSAVSQMAKAIDTLPLSKASDTARNSRTEGTKLLQYPPDIWLFSPQNKLLPVTSSNTQYKKARKNYNIFNQEIASGNAVLDRTPQNLLLMMLIIKKDLENTIGKTENHIREESLSFIDFSADTVFYFEKGKLYAYSQIFRDLSLDFKDTMIRYDIYQQWTSMLSVLNEGGIYEPMIIRNASPDSSFAPNHLITLNSMASRSLDHINNIIIKLTNLTDTK